MNKNNDILLTLAITVYKPEYYEIQNWIHYQEVILKSTKKVQFIFLIDNPNIDKNILNILNNSKSEYKVFEKNFGKFFVIKDAADEDLIKGKFLKVCDPDDLIDTQKLLKFLPYIEKFKDSENYLILTLNGVIGAGAHSYKNFNNKRVRKQFIKIPVNYNTIFTTKNIKELEDKFLNLNKSSDALLSILVLMKKEMVFITIENFFFYIYNSRNGISNSRTRFNYNKKTLKEEYASFAKQEFRFLSILNSRKNQINSGNFSYFTFPKKFDLYTMNNFLIKSNLNFFTRMKYVHKSCKIFKNLNTSEEIFWTNFKFLKYYYLQIVKKIIII